MPADAPGEVVATLVLVTGVPGAGKTTLGRALAGALHVPFLSLDTMKERLYAAQPGELDDWELRQAAEAELAAELAGGDCTVVVDIWIAPQRDTDRVAAVLRRQGRPVVEMLCTVPADVAVERYSRRRRSGPHRDADEATLRRIRSAVEMIEPIGVGRCIEVDTSGTLRIEALTEQLVLQLGGATDDSSP